MSSPPPSSFSASASPSFAASSAAFRQYLPDLSTPRFTTAAQQSPEEYAAYFRDNQAPPWLYALTQTWQKLLDEPFRGVAIDDTVDPSIFPPSPTPLPASLLTHIHASLSTLLSTLPPPLRTQLIHPLSSRAVRSWSNPEVLLRPLGLRLESLAPEQHTAALGLIQATLSPEGWAKCRGAMRVNGFLGRLTGLGRVMNEGSYNLVVFGDVAGAGEEGEGRGEGASGKAWGWSLYGHHLCLSVFMSAGGALVISPAFIGAEPGVIDAPGEAGFGTEILREEGVRGRALMDLLGEELRKKAVVYAQLKDPAMRVVGDLETDRWNKDDQRHLCGAFRDNRQMPQAEGVCAREMDAGQREALVRVVEEFVVLLPAEARRVRIEEVRRWLDETWFSWIGGWGEEDAFYFRVQSPVVVVEFDHHSGVFLTNEEPKRFHTHTIIRTPNGGDYGNALRAEGDKVP